MDLFARPPPRTSGAASAGSVSMTQPTPSAISATGASHRKKTAASRLNTAAAAAAPTAQSGGGNNAADASEEKKSAGGDAAPAAASSVGASSTSSTSAPSTSSLPSSTSSASRMVLDLFAPRPTSVAAAAAGSGGSSGSTSSSTMGAGSSVGGGGLKIRGAAGTSTPAKRGNRAMSSGGGGAGAAAASGSAASSGGSRMGGVQAKRPRGFAGPAFAPGASRAESAAAGGYGGPMAGGDMSIIGDIKEEGMQQLPSAMEYDSGGATYQQHAAYGQQWQPQQHHPMQMMQARAPIYSAPAAAYPVVEPVDLSGVDPTDNASPVAVLDVMQLSLAIFKGQEMASRSRTELFAASDTMQQLMGLLGNTWQSKFTELQNRVTPQHAQPSQRYTSAPAYAPVTPVVRSAPMAPRRAQFAQQAQTATAPSSGAAAGGFKAGAAASGQPPHGN